MRETPPQGTNEVASGLAQMINEKQAAAVLSVSVAALRRWRREGRGPEFTRLERCVRYSIRAVENFVAENASTKKLPIRSRQQNGRHVHDYAATQE